MKGLNDFGIIGGQIYRKTILAAREARSAAQTKIMPKWQIVENKAEEAGCTVVAHLMVEFESGN
ncbi:MAG: hypothetical protein ABI282_06235 [Candidatus Baltobacteraceae bacterium]